MLCDECKKRQATVHVIKIMNNQKIEQNLCEVCANSAGLMVFAVNPQSFTVQDFLKGMFHHISHEEPPTTVACPDCGMTYQDFSRSGKIGCSTCYKTFSSELETVIRRIHGTSAHTGKVPHRSGEVLEAKQQLKRLRQLLEKAIEKEEYENAAKIRDEIRSLEKVKVKQKGDDKGE
ncbi:protein arginine kinase activator [Sporomusaceae bacterium BoRhaA]|uniref:UvrB/UvrC motif-containing protein n=1 Tax=Pelorhabdus rhamnosifermentans TaxID=2772457 RepID=UPI001C063721|nr:UvrB/UvrC motif-containing protein [Pelorhabdus rhamnosifermentans]MBU2701575.1 protein arginine kinase activator [Pelorhabdus rhamnosifermentans]